MKAIEGQQRRALLEEELSDCGSDLSRLEEMAEHLKHVDDAWAGSLRLKAINQMRKARKALPEADGRPLFAYRLHQEQFEYWQDTLAAQAASGRNLHEGAFVLWAAEWFRRCYQGGMLKWELLSEPLGIVYHGNEYNKWKTIADRGLAYWKLKPLRTEYRQLRLVAIARQSGFPVAAIAQGQQGWAYRFLKRLVARLVGTARIDRELGIMIAHDEENIVPDTWREVMREVCVELALAIVVLRKEAEAGGVGPAVLVSSWLDQNKSDWRNTLPLNIEGHASALVDALLRTEADVGSGATIRARRYLKPENGDWLEYLALELNGCLPLSAEQQRTVDAQHDISRLRLYFAGKLAQMMTGEIAMAMRPDKPGMAWPVRAGSMIRDIAYPFIHAVTTEMRADGERVASPFDLRGGEAVRSGMRIYEPQLDENGNIQRLWLKSWSSGAFRADELVVETPSKWQVMDSDDSASILVEDDKRILWHISSELIVENPQGDQFLIRPGQNVRQRDQIYLVGKEIQQIFHEEGLPVFAGPPTPHISNIAGQRAAGEEKLGWRHAGARNWNRGSSGVGKIEYGWRDAQTGHLRAIATAIVLPEDFEISSQKTRDWLTITLSGWVGNAKLEAAISVGPGKWRTNIAQPSRDKLSLNLDINGQKILSLQYPLPQISWIAQWDGKLVPPGARLSLSTLHQYVARGNGFTLMADVDRRSVSAVKNIGRQWKIEDVMGLSSMHDDLARMIRPLGIDTSVCLNFNDGSENDGLKNSWFVEEFETTLEKRGERGWYPANVIQEETVEIRARPLANAAHEKVIGNYSLQDANDGNPLHIPNLEGQWLVYLAVGDRVLSRPIPMGEVTANHQAHSRLGKAMSPPDAVIRHAALQDFVDAIIKEPSCEKSVADIRDMIALAASLNTMPPATFDLFKMMNENPHYGPLMLMHSGRAEMQNVLALSDGLLFDWAMVPRECWKTAYDALGTYYTKSLPVEAGGDQAAHMEFVIDLVNKQCDAIIEERSWLRPLLKAAPTNSVTFEDIYNAMVERSGDRINKDDQNPFRPDLAHKLPNIHFSTGISCVLDAPWAAALAACGQVELKQKQIITMRDVRERHPTYFAEAYAHALGVLI